MAAVLDQRGNGGTECRRAGMPAVALVSLVMRWTLAQRASTGNGPSGTQKSIVKPCLRICEIRLRHPVPVDPPGSESRPISFPCSRIRATPARHGAPLIYTVTLTTVFCHAIQVLSRVCCANAQRRVGVDVLGGDRHVVVRKQRSHECSSTQPATGPTMSRVVLGSPAPQSMATGVGRHPGEPTGRADSTVNDFLLQDRVFRRLPVQSSNPLEHCRRQTPQPELPGRG